MAKVHIDRDECISCAQCWETCPQYFEPDENDDMSRVIKEYEIENSLADGVVPDDLSECVNDAAEGCPVAIIHITD